MQYVRTPYIMAAGNVRVTLDENIASSQAVSRFFERDIPTRQILPARQGILEVKWDQFLPDFIKKLLQTDDLQWTAFSKYYYCRRFNTNGGNIL